MVRNYKKKRDTYVIEEDANRAVLCVVNDGMKLRTAAAIYNIRPNTLFYRVKKYKENIRPKNEDYTSKYTVSQAFTNDEEKMLEKYFIKMTKMKYGLTYLRGRKLAYEYAKAIKKCPEKWETEEKAGIEWMKGFMKRHKNLSLRKPENTSLSRSTSFNKHNVDQFFDNYDKALKKHNFTPDRIYNLDETNIMTVVQAPKIIAQKGLKQVGQSVSAERGQLITMCAIVNALGNTIPPVFIFPRARFHDTMLFGAPPGSLGLANSPTSGWMTGPLFVKVLQHIQKTTRCSKEDKILILMDNHESHCTLDAINFCRENGIVLLTFPPHCTHKMQPLDVAVNSSFKAKLAVSQNDWLLNHPGKTISIHDLAGIVTPAYNASHTINNITSGFSKPGIYPFCRNKFTDDDFECSEVTNRPMDNNSLPEESNNTHASPNANVIEPLVSMDATNAENMPEETINNQSILLENGDAPDAATGDMPEETRKDMPLIPGNIDSPDDAPSAEDIPEKNRKDQPVMTEDSDATDAEDIIEENRHSPSLLMVNNESTVDSDNTKQTKDVVSPVQVPHNDHVVCPIAVSTPSKLISPEDVMPFPKAAPRKGTKGRKKARSRVLTDTPEKNIIESAYLERMRRLNKSSIRPKKVKNLNKNKKTKLAKKKIVRHDLSSESDVEEDIMSVHDDSDMDVSDCKTDDEQDFDEANVTIPYQLRPEDLKVGSFILVKCESAKKMSYLHFVAKIINKEGSLFTVLYLKRKYGQIFFFPDKVDEWSVSILDIVAKLPAPVSAAGTSRTASLFTFKFDFTPFKLG